MKTARSLKFKLLAGGIMVILVPLVIVAVFVYFQVSAVLDEQAKAECETVAVSLAAMLNIGMAEQLNIVKGIVNDATDLAQGYAQGDKDAAKLISRKLEAVAQAAPGTYETIVFVVGGKVVADASNGKTVGLDVSERSYWRAAMQGKTDIGMVAKSKASGNPITVASVPILSADKKPIAAIASIINIQYLTKELSQVKMGKTGYAFATDKGLMIAHPKKETILEFDVTKQPEMGAFAEKMIAGKPGSAEYALQGSKNWRDLHRYR